MMASQGTCLQRRKETSAPSEEIRTRLTPRLSSAAGDFVLVTQTLMDDFRTCQGYFLTEFLLKCVKVDKTV
jgi:hypothetical protein